MLHGQSRQDGSIWRGNGVLAPALSRA